MQIKVGDRASGRLLGVTAENMGVSMPVSLKKKLLVNIFGAENRHTHRIDDCKPMRAAGFRVGQRDVGERAAVALNFLPFALRQTRIVGVAQLPLGLQFERWPIG